MNKAISASVSLTFLSHAILAKFSSRKTQWRVGFWTLLSVFGNVVAHGLSSFLYFIKHSHLLHKINTRNNEEIEFSYMLKLKNNEILRTKPGTRYFFNIHLMIIIIIKSFYHLFSWLTMWNWPSSSLSGSENKRERNTHKKHGYARRELILRIKIPRGSSTHSYKLW